MPEQNITSIPTCGKCASWAENSCHCEYSPHSNTFRQSDAPACAEYVSAQKLADSQQGFFFQARHWVENHAKSTIAFVVAIIVFIGAWLITGDIWAAIIIFEILLEILGEF